MKISFYKNYCVSATPEEFFQALRLVCGTVEISTGYNYFHLVSPNEFSNDLKFVPRASLYAKLEPTKSGTIVRAHLSTTFTWIEVLICVCIFALWIAERVWAWQNHIEGLFIPSWSLKTWVFGPILLFGLICHCCIRVKQKSGLLAVVDEAAAMFPKR